MQGRLNGLNGLYVHFACHGYFRGGVCIVTIGLFKVICSFSCVSHVFCSVTSYNFFYITCKPFVTRWLMLHPETRLGIL